MPRVRAGDWVEVLSVTEIEATLDDAGTLGGMPFMPEMLRHAGHRFRVRQRAERTCVHPPEIPFRELQQCVTLAGLRCDGSAHGGCELGCMLFWKDAWVRRVEGPSPAGPDPDGPHSAALDSGAALRPVTADGAYLCQGTQLVSATSPGEPLWAPRQYARFLRDGTFTRWELIAMLARLGLRKAASVLRRLRPSDGEHEGVSPLGLQPGDWVTVRGRGEIRRTLDASGKLAGLAFGGDMVNDCGKTLQVDRRVERIMDERTGRIRQVKDTVLLRGSVCDRYLGCARGMPILWREAWLRRVGGPVPGSAAR